MKKIIEIISPVFLLFNTFLFSQTYYSENFETPSNINSWTLTDLNSDNLNWRLANSFETHPIFGNYMLISNSVTENSEGATVGVSPDNLITSPLINLTSVTASNIVLFYNYETYSEYPSEHYAVYVTTTNNPNQIISSTPVFETTATGGLGFKQIDLTNFIGQNIYISFRHFDCYNNLFLVIDNLEIKSLIQNDLKLITSELPRYALTGSSNILKLNVKNNGANAINNLTINWNDGVDHSSLINMSIASGVNATINHPIPVQYSNIVEKDILITISQMNGVADNNMSDNLANIKFNTLSQNSPRKVLYEEGTGTWCGYCPAGAVVLEELQTDHSNETIGVAIHHDDPMTNDEYDNASGFQSFPTFNVDRVFLNKSAHTEGLLMFKDQRNLTPCPVSVDINGSSINSNFTFNVTALFRTSFTNTNFRFGIIITEDNVTGTDFEYSQYNSYSGQSTPMGGYELLPQLIPAEQMVYNHVGRALLGGYNGQAGSIPSVITDGQVYNYTFNYTVPSTSSIANMNAIIVVIDQLTGEVVNSKSVPLSTFSLANNDFNSLDTIKIYPNPTNDFFKFSNLKEGNYDVVIYDMSGKLVQSKNNISVVENESVTVPVNQLAKGVYMVNIASGKTSYSKQLLID